MYNIYMPFWKQHKYKTHADLKDMTPEQIIRLDPDMVKSSIEQNPGGHTLTDKQLKALRRLLSIKRTEKANKGMSSESKMRAREKEIRRFLGNDDREANEIVSNTYHEMGEDKVQFKHLQNRLRTLKNIPEDKYSDEELMHLRMSHLRRKGGKTRRRTSRKTHKKQNGRRRKRSSKHAH